MLPVFCYLSDVAGDKKFFKDLVCKKHPEDALIQNGGEGTLGQTSLSRDALTTIFVKVQSTFISKPNLHSIF